MKDLPITPSSDDANFSLNNNALLPKSNPSLTQNAFKSKDVLKGDSSINDLEVDSGTENEAALIPRVSMLNFDDLLTDDVVSSSTAMSTSTASANNKDGDDRETVSSSGIYSGPSRYQDADKVNCNGLEYDDLKRGYEKKLRDKDSIISDMRDENRRESVKLKQRYEQERIELNLYAEEQKRLYTDALAQAKEYKRDLQDKKWQLEMIQNDITTNKDSCNLLQRKIDLLQKELTHVNEEKDKVSKQKKFMENALYECESEMADIKSSRLALQSSQTSLKLEFLNVQDEISNRDEQIAELETKMAAYKHENSNLIKESQTLKDEVEEKDIGIASLKRDKEDMDSRYRQLEMSANEMAGFRKRANESEIKCRELTEEHYNKEYRLRERIEEIEYELECSQNSLRNLQETVVIENSELKKKNSGLEEKLEEQKKKAFQSELKMQEFQSQVKTCQRQNNKLEEKLDSVEINYHALLKQKNKRQVFNDTPFQYNSYMGLGPEDYNNYGMMNDMGMGTMANGNGSVRGSTALRNYPRHVNRRYLSSTNVSNTPVNGAWERHYENGYSNDPDGYYENAQFPNERYMNEDLAQGWNDNSFKRHADRNSRGIDEIETYTDEFGFERPVFKNKPKNCSTKSDAVDNPGCSPLSKTRNNTHADPSPLFPVHLNEKNQNNKRLEQDYDSEQETITQ
ncbi:paramyosin-like isoform X2 [Gordionus sp. m RMFG-2023]|uniref:paramyosin-like isoform X2 n=1 Tax=Gordionus sp. m RMFG-2023 TaxID=3053472 RepID=UPI0031FD6053